MRAKLGIVGCHAMLWTMLDYLYLPPNSIIPVAHFRPFRAVIIAELTVEAGWRDEVADWLVVSGCLYTISWGIDCEAWHDCIDWAVLEYHHFAEIPDERFVMTIWHDNEPLSEALWFAGFCASRPDVELDETRLIHIAQSEKRAALLETYRDSQASESET
jgi:hypothetical protein